MRIKFTHDFRGKLTDEQFYPAGTEIEVSAEVGAQLVALRHAEDVTPAPAPQPESKPAANSRRKSKPKAQAVEKDADDNDESA